MENYISYVPVLLQVIILIFALLIARSFMTKKIAMMTYVKSFGDYIAVLEYHMTKAYDIIHKDRILTYSLDGYNVKDEEFDVITKDFVILTKKLMGPALCNEFLMLYGDQATFYFTLTEYFNTCYENDEIRSNANKDIQEVDKETQQLQGILNGK